MTQTFTDCEIHGLTESLPSSGRCLKCIAEEIRAAPWPIISRKDAAAQHRKKYFTGKACKFGHVSQRYVKSGMCVACNRERCNSYRRAAAPADGRVPFRARIYEKHRGLIESYILLLEGRTDET